MCVWRYITIDLFKKSDFSDKMKYIYIAVTYHVISTTRLLIEGSGQLFD